MQEEEYKDLLKGMRGFLRFSMDHENISKEQIIGTIIHDINGTLHEEDCFAPRTEPYRDYQKKVTA